jgi:hypothetical protein
MPSTRRKSLASQEAVSLMPDTLTHRAETALIGALLTNRPSKRRPTCGSPAQTWKVPL